MIWRKQVKNAGDELTEIAEKNISGKEKRVEELINIMFDEYDLQATLYNIRYNDFYTDVTNESIEKELPEIEQNYSEYYDIIFSALNKAYNSDYQDLMFELLDQDIITAITFFHTTDEKYTELSNEESKLDSWIWNVWIHRNTVSNIKVAAGLLMIYTTIQPENEDEYNRISNMFTVKK